jgi:hypothetical protein
MCDNLDEEIKSLKAKNVTCAMVEKAEWGKFTILRLPSGGEIGLYEPSHATAIDLR